MSARAWLWLACITSICSFAACGDDDDMGPPLDRDGGSDSGMDAGQDAGPPGPDSAMPDASKDATVDASLDASDDAGQDATSPDATFLDAGTAPEDWTCLTALWNDGWCDCGCSAHDVDCFSNDCIEPGCIDGSSCQACFTLEGSWQSCVPEPDSGNWSCLDSLRDDGVNCDCGCGAPDPDCMGQGCSEPGCVKPDCVTRHGCDEIGLDPLDDDCTSNNPPDGRWKCPWGTYGSGDGCDCGCGAIDPDCAGSGCSDSQCYAVDGSCDRCNDADGRPYGCAAAEVGWGGAQCNSAHFDANDGCDCGCGGIDPDCGADEGCIEPGCNDDGCDRCTTDIVGLPTGCAVAGWDCPAANYGTGDGCDCGCGADDPDCDVAGSSDQSFEASCDVCHSTAPGNEGGFVKCPGWTCEPLSTTPDLYFDDECDCGCGVIDPYCRDTRRASCTEPDCPNYAVCDYCTDEQGARTACGPVGDWDPSAGTCNVKFYDLDGLCDCGCGADDPDCGDDLGCSGSGCMAPGCDVCHDSSSLLLTCEVWHCDASAFDDSDNVCDCGCGADDPDCAGGGCKDPGCNDQTCDACHDPYGRVVECP